ncbi:MAG: hypothetical protein QOF96_217 [Actinomycetota bacterium]|jgi:hypothetical protein|nr:hypothetical protein [Actinomycetota bacterium]
MTQSPRIPRPYAAIAADPTSRAVLEVPTQWRTGFGDYGDTEGDHSIFLYYATRHHKPLVSGMVARYPVQARRQLLNEPLYRELIDLENGAASLPTFGVDDLRQLGIGYIVYHRDRPRPAAEAYLTGLQLPVLADDGTVLVWKVP